MKQTEIGLIPDDWEVKTLEEICIPKGIVRGPFGGALKKSVFVSKGYKVYEQRNAIYKNITDGNYYINESKYNEMIRFSVTRGDFIISCSGTIGRIFRIPNNYYKGIINQALLKLTINEDIIDPSYFCAYFDSDCYQQKIIDDTQGGAMKNLVGMEKFRKTCFPLPPLPEQQRIAKALSDVDALILTTEKLLQKKKNIKQGTMQELLTGKKRLPGFAKSTNYKQSELGLIPEDWEVKSFGELFDMKAGGDVDKEHFSYFKSSIYKYKIFSNGLENEGIYGYTDLPKYKGNAITITGRGTVGIAMFREEDFDAVIRLLVLNSKNDNLTNNSYITEEINSCISFPNESTGVPQLTVPQIRDIVIVLPSKEEQTAIANVLSSMDKEIETLNTKLEKYRNFKTAMMQQLLTGKIRLK
ncbi:MAG: restriction endonuclease subunit S [Treponemataceae bacterium]|nr:restriction endonuclease subunit S [Treponemataceae bacterium]